MEVNDCRRRRRRRFKDKALSFGCFALQDMLRLLNCVGDKGKIIIADFEMTYLKACSNVYVSCGRSTVEVAFVKDGLSYYLVEVDIW